MVGYKRRDGPPSVDNHDIKAKEDSSLPEVKKINHEESSCGEFQIHHILHVWRRYLTYGPYMLYMNLPSN